MVLRIGALLALLAVAVGAGCGGDDELPPAATTAADEVQAEAPVGAWRRLPAPPLSPRQWAVGAWTGTEVVVAGGSEAPACPANADCVTPRAPLAEGAALDLQTGTWRPIADAPVAFDWGQAAAVGGTVYVWVPPSPAPPASRAAFMAYDAAADHWERLPVPPAAEPAWLAVAAAGDGVVAYAGSDEQIEQPDWRFRPATGAWEELPDDPLGPSFDRALVSVAGRIVLTAKELVPNPGAEEPAVVLAAVYDPATDAWSELPASDSLGNGAWLPVGERLVNPALGDEDGGEVGNWGRDVPNGAILDLTGSPAWRALPPGPSPETALPVGVLGDGTAAYLAPAGWLLDLDAAGWRQVTAPAGIAQNATVVTAGRLLVAVGGAADAGSDDGALVLTNAAAVWDPDAIAP